MSLVGILKHQKTLLDYKTNTLKVIDKLVGYNEKLEYLNKCYLKADSDNKESIILDMIKDLKQWGC